MSKISNNLSEEGEIIPLSDFTQALIGRGVLQIKQRDLYQSKFVTLKYEEVEELYQLLKEVMGDE